MEVGPVATDFEQEEISTTIAKCQRYYQKFWRTVANSGNDSTYPGTILSVSASTAALISPVILPVLMRAEPSFSYYRAGVVNKIYNVDSAGEVSPGALSQNWYSTHSVQGMVFSGTPLVSGTTYGFDFILDAEL